MRIAAWHRLLDLVAPPAKRAFAASGVKATRPLNFRGGILSYASGEPVTLRGVSLFWSQWAPAFYNPELVQWLANDWKVDVIRIPVAATAPGFLDSPQTEVAKAITVIDAAIACGLYVVVDWHGHHPHTEQAIQFFEIIARRYGDDPHILYESWNEPDTA